MGYYLYPEAEGADDLKLWMNRGSTYEANVMPVMISALPNMVLKIPVDAQDYDGFVASMKSHEKAFKNTFLVSAMRGE